MLFALSPWSPCSRIPLSSHVSHVPPTSPLYSPSSFPLFFRNGRLARRTTQPLSHSTTQSLIHSVAHPQLASSGPEPIVLDSMALVDQTPSIYCPQQRVECAPQTRAMPCFVTGNRNFGSSPERSTVYCISLLYPQLDVYLSIYGWRDGIGIDGMNACAWQQPLRTTHTVRILLVCGAVLRLLGLHGLSPVRTARARQL